MRSSNPVEQRDENGQVVAVTDPVADIVAYLMSRPAGDWTPRTPSCSSTPTSGVRSTNWRSFTCVTTFRKRRPSGS